MVPEDTSVLEGKVDGAGELPDKGGAGDHIHKEGVRKRTRKSYPTIRQIKTLQFMNQGMSKRKAMMMAGYKAGWASRPYKEFFRSPAVRSVLLGMKDILVDMGLTKEFMAAKVKEWVTASNGDKPDYETQIKAYDRWEKIMEKEENIQAGGGKVKRRIEFTEFVTGGGDDTNG